MVGLADDKTLWGWGRNSLALGYPVSGASSTYTLEPLALPTPPSVSSWRSVAVSDNATLAISSGGVLWAAGSLGGHLFNGWTRVSDLSGGCLEVECGLDHCIVLTTTGFAGIGANDQNQAVPVLSIGPTATPPTAALHTSLFRFNFTNLGSPAANTPVPIINSILPRFCTGRSHTTVVWAGVAYIWGACGSVFTGSCVTPSNGIWMPSMAAVDGTVLQLECGRGHSVLRTTTSTYAIGLNDVDQISVAALASFVPSWTDMFPLDNGFGLNPFVIAGDLALGRSSRSGTTFVPNSILSLFPGLDLDLEGPSEPSSAPASPGSSSPVASFINSTFSIGAFKRPSWLRLRRIDVAFGSSIRSTLAVRFREDDGACSGNRPFPSIVCAPSYLNPLKSGWISQRSLSIVSSSKSTIELPGAISVFGQLWTDPDVTISIPYSTSGTFPVLAVTQCAQLQGPINVALDSDAFKSIKSKSGSKVTVPLVQAGCRMFQHDDLSQSKRGTVLRNDNSIEAARGEMYVIDLDTDQIQHRRDFSGKSSSDRTVKNAVRLVRSPGFVYGEFGISGLGSSAMLAERKATPDSYTDPAVPDNSIPPNNPATAEKSNSTITVVPSSGDKLKSCQKKSITSEQQTSGSNTQLLATIAVESDGCNTWWIILVSVFGGVALLVIIALIIVFSVPSIRLRVLPYKGSRGRSL